MVQEITDVTQIPTGGKVVLDFYATWCGPCKRIAPMFKELSEKFPTIQFFKVDVDEANDVSEQFSVESLPTFVFLKDGNVMGRLEGADFNNLLALLEKLEKI